jgi:hypothetical protein
LQPDYVKSILVARTTGPTPTDEADEYYTSFSERLVERVERDAKLGQRIYDEERIPVSLLHATETEEGDQ